MEASSIIVLVFIIIFIIFIVIGIWLSPGYVTSSYDPYRHSYGAPYGRPYGPPYAYPPMRPQTHVSPLVRVAQAISGQGQNTQ